MYGWIVFNRSATKDVSCKISETCQRTKCLRRIFTSIYILYHSGLNFVNIYNMQNVCLIWNVDLKMSRYYPTWRWYLNFCFILKNCLGIFIPFKKSCLKPIICTNEDGEWKKQLVYSKCTLFKIITLIHFVLLYICVQGQSLFVNYIGL